MPDSSAANNETMGDPKPGGGDKAATQAKAKADKAARSTLREAMTSAGMGERAPDRREDASDGDKKGSDKGADSKTATDVKDKSDKSDKSKSKHAGRDKKSTTGPKPSKRHRETAKRLGVSDEQMEGLDEHGLAILEAAGREGDRQAGTFGKELEDRDKTIAELTGKLEAGGKPGDEGGDDDADAKAAEKKDVAAGKAGDGTGSLDVAFTDDDSYEEGDGGRTAKLNALAKGVQAELTAKSAENKALREDVHALTTRLDDGDVDQFFAGLDPKVYPQFGTGSTDSLDEESDELAARMDLRIEAAQFRKGKAFSKERVSLVAAMRRMLVGSSEDDIRADERQKVGRQMSRRGGQGPQRPGSRTATKAPQTPEAASRKHVRDAMAEAGLA